jgi:hypothetical protein
MGPKIPRNLIVIDTAEQDGLYVREISSHVTLFIVNRPSLLPVEPQRNLLRVLDCHCRLNINQRIVSASAGMEVLLRGNERVAVYPHEGQATLLRTIRKEDGDSEDPRRNTRFGPWRPRFV